MKPSDRVRKAMVEKNYIAEFANIWAGATIAKMCLREENPELESVDLGKGDWRIFAHGEKSIDVIFSFQHNSDSWEVPLRLHLEGGNVENIV